MPFPTSDPSRIQSGCVITSINSGLAAVVILAAVVCSTLTGCGSGVHATALSFADTSLSGYVHSGSDPVANASIQLYAVGQGSGAASQPLLKQQVHTGADGGFVLQQTYTCPNASTPVYIVATGGSVKSQTSANNDATTLMASLGNCGDLEGLPSQEINELTTVASISTFAPYMKSTLSIAADVDGAQDLSAAFTSARQLADTLQEANSDPSLPQSQTDPIQKLATLADILSSCIKTTGGSAGDGTPCGNLFTYTQPPQSFVAPRDTSGAMLEISKNPAYNVDALYSLTPTTPPFQPLLSAAPVDWKLIFGPTPPQPVFSPSPGTYNGPQTITLTDSTAGVRLYYTIDGTWHQYTGALTLPISKTIHAFAIAGGISLMASGTYTIAPPALSISAASIATKGQTETGTVTLTAAAPQGGTLIHLASSASTVAAVSPSTIAIAQGQQSGSFTYTGMANGVATLTAAATGFTTSSTQITVVPPVVVSVTPGRATLLPSQTQQFTSAVTGSSNTAVTWSLNPAVGSISATGIYTAPATIATAQTVTVTATSAADSTKAASAVLTISPTYVTVTAGDDVAKIVNSSPSGTTFVLTNGVYVMQQITPKSGDVFIGQTSTILTGARSVTQFGRSGPLWTAPFVGQPGQAQGSCVATSPACLYPEDLYFDNVPLQRVISLSLVTTGKWFLDYSNAIIYLADAPTGHVVEISSARSAFSGPATDVTISNLIVEKYAIPAQMGAIGDQYPGNGWHIFNSEARLNHGTGILVNDNGVIQGCSSHDNGQQGIAAHGANVSIISNTISNNNFSGFDPGWEAGGAKFSYTTNLNVSNNVVFENVGPGLWTDINNVGTSYKGNIVYSNVNEGIKHEISYAATISGNVLYNNGNGFSVWLWGSQILIQNSQNVDVHDNQVTVAASFGNGIGLIYQNRGTGSLGSWDTKNNFIHNNSITYEGRSGQTGMVADYNQQNAMSWNNTFDSNTYTVKNANDEFWTLQNWMNWAQFQSSGQEPNGILGVVP